MDVYKLQTKKRESVSGLSTDPNYPKSRLAYSDREKADVLEIVYVFLIQLYVSIAPLLLIM